MNGSITIETTYVMVIVIGVIALFIYLWIYLYNSYFLEKTIEQSLIHWEKEWDYTNQEIEQIATTEIINKLKSGLLGCATEYATVRSNYFTIEIKGGYKMNVSLSNLFSGIIGNHMFGKEYIGKINRENQVDYIRIYRGLKEFIQEDN